MRRFLLTLFLVVIYDQSLIEHDPVVYYIKEEVDESIEVICPEGYENCNEEVINEPTYEDVIQVIHDRFNF